MPVTRSYDYDDISRVDPDTNVTGAELEELTDASETTLHSHAGGGGGISNVVEDLTPQLGGNLDIQAFNIEGADAADFVKLSELTATSTELNYVDGVTSAIQTQLDAKTTLAAVYPVGCIYTSTVSTNPATVFGFGTWTAFGAGRVLVGLDAGQTEFDTVEETGGAKTHTLTEAEIPGHTHSLGTLAMQDTGSGVFPSTTGGGAGATGSTGGGGAHNNLQPYIVVYMWKRTA